MFCRFLLLALLATSCAPDGRAVYLTKPAPAYMAYPLARPVKVARDSHGHVIKIKK
jgi:hypothetical protein